MDYFLAMCFIGAVVFGVVGGLDQIFYTRNHPEFGYKPSKNIFTFLFNDKY